MVVKIRTYSPDRKIKIEKEAAIPFLFYISSKLSSLNLFFAFIGSSFIAGAKSLFKVKSRIRDFTSKNERVLDLSKRQRINLINA